MDAFEAIHGRRSIRRYTGEPVDEESMERVLRAAMAAPSAGNQQPWQFVVLDDRGLIDRIPEFHPYAEMLREAPAAVVVCGDTRGAPHKGYWEQDCSAATQNLLLAAHALGLGAVWLGVHPLADRVEALGELLGLPTDVIPLAVIALGHPAEEKPPADRFDASRVHRNGW